MKTSWRFSPSWPARAGLCQSLPCGGWACPRRTLQTLVKRGLVTIEERPAAFHLSAAGVATQHELNHAQQAALGYIVATLDREGFGACLLHGVTGSGKTAVYLAAMQRARLAGRSAILLVPEIGLTPAMAAQLHSSFGAGVALLHSALTPDERAEQWYRIRRGEARIVVGTRSAVFAPVENLGLIIVDEEHDSSYKQEEIPRYHARDVAVMRAKISGATVVLGSATPSLESWRNAETGKYALIEMKERVSQRPLPVVDLVDMRLEFQQTGQESIFSRVLLERAKAAIDRGEQAIILLNRRGYSFAVLCRCLRREAAMRELRHRPHPPQAHYPGRSARGRAEPLGPTAQVSLLRIRENRAQTMSQVRERAPVLPGRRFAAGRRASAGAVSPGPHRPHGPRHHPQPFRHGAPAGRGCTAGRSTSW